MWNRARARLALCTSLEVARVASCGSVNTGAKPDSILMAQRIKTSVRAYWRPRLEPKNKHLNDAVGQYGLPSGIGSSCIF